MYQFSLLEKDVTALVRPGGLGRNAPEASAGFPLGSENLTGSPPEEAGRFFPARPSEKPAPHDSKRSAPTPGPWDRLAPIPQLSSNG